MHINHISTEGAPVLAPSMYHPAVSFCVIRSISAVQQRLLENQKQHHACKTPDALLRGDLRPLPSTDRINNLHY